MDTISRSTLIKVSNLLGYDPHDVKEFHILPFEIRTTLFERDEHGQKIRKDNGESAVRVEVLNVSA